MKAWSQNLGHADLLTTFTKLRSGAGPSAGELIHPSGTMTEKGNLLDDPDVRALIERIQKKT